MCAFSLLSPKGEMAAGSPLTAESGRIPQDVTSLSRCRRSDDSGTTEREAWEFGQAWNICSSFLLFNRLMTRLSLFPKGPQSALLWRGSNAVDENKLGNQQREQHPGLISDCRFEARPIMGTLPAFGVLDIDRSWSNVSPLLQVRAPYGGFDFSKGADREHCRNPFRDGAEDERGLHEGYL
jgi:hypothetical protein